MAVIEAIVFDFDLTLVDSSRGIWMTIGALARERGLREPSIDEVRATIGYPLRSAMEGFWGNLDSTWIERYREIFAEHDYWGVDPMPGAFEALERLKDMGIRLAVATNRTAPEAIVEATGVAAFCPVVVGIRDLPAKPNPAIILEALRRLDVAPARSAYAGDTDIDMKAATAARCLALGVTTGNHGTTALAEAGAAHVMASLTELPELAMSLL